MGMGILNEENEKAKILPLRMGRAGPQKNSCNDANLRYINITCTCKWVGNPNLFQCDLKHKHQFSCIIKGLWGYGKIKERISRHRTWQIPDLWICSQDLHTWGYNI
jgi:hypothetical protein